MVMPQWQGGNNPNYSLGSDLLAWLAPESEQPFVRVPVSEDASISEKNGIVARGHLLKQLEAADHIIQAHKPDRIVMFGGDCLANQAPLAYLNERYNGELGLLWIDAHPDVTTPKQMQNAHAMVLGNLLGEGDQEFANHVKTPFDPKKVMFAGLEETASHETEVIQRLGIKTARTEELETNSKAVMDWAKENDIKHLAIHLDLDVLDPSVFRSLLFANPYAEEEIGAPSGKMDFPALTRLIQDVSQQTEVVELGITEHMPWDAINLKSMLNGIPILNS
ncbi:arginase family protein [Salicibibacter cibarius]|uniref:Arginase family protein n=1 Tax=Salicibibacter cibarius TaxID=2743000 RepID=A0A7T6Z7K1_9BACI|nr:arginase family protein [Salicibibacter cibarius]QQK78406.1 arginase family protein [Salicibibacter cibarius]